MNEAMEIIEAHEFENFKKMVVRIQQKNPINN